MADYSGGPAPISLSQAAPVTSSSSSDHPPTLSITPSVMVNACASTSSKRRSNKSKDKGIAIETTPTTGRKPRGRPPGSKNKPKPPVIITRETPASFIHPPALTPVILEVTPGSDIIESIITFARRQNKGISVINASGSVSAVTLRHVSLHGPFTLISLSGTYLENADGSPVPSFSFGITLSASQGQVFGGVVGGKVTAGGQVVVVANVFENAVYLTLPERDHGGNARIAEEEVKDGEESVGYDGSPTPMNCQMPPSDHGMHWGAPRPPAY